MWRIVFPGALVLAWVCTSTPTTDEPASEPGKQELESAGEGYGRLGLKLAEISSLIEFADVLSQTGQHEEALRSLAEAQELIHALPEDQTPEESRGRIDP